MRPVVPKSEANKFPAKTRQKREETRRLKNKVQSKIFTYFQKRYLPSIKPVAKKFAQGLDNKDGSRPIKKKATRGRLFLLLYFRGLRYL